jgi:hypothetical protein
MQLRQQRHRAILATRPGVVGSFAAIECDGTVHIPSDKNFDPLVYGFFATDPYLIGMVMASLHIVDKESEGPFGRFRKNDSVLAVKLWTATTPGGRTYRSMEEDVPIIVFSEDYIRSLSDLEFPENRSSSRGQSGPPSRTLTAVAAAALLIATATKGAGHCDRRIVGNETVSETER